MNSFPFFTIVIPTYNREACISDAVNSVLNQTWTDFELIVVDDGSVDNTASIIRSFETKDPRVKYIYQDNAERSAARNKGIENARGNHICFLDSDDTYLPDHLHILKREIDNDPNFMGIVFTQCLIDQVVQPWVMLSESDSKYDFIVLNSLTSQQACVNSEILSKHQYNPNLRIAEDRDLWLRICMEYDLKTLDIPTVQIKNMGDKTTDLRNLESSWENLTNLKIITRNYKRFIKSKARKKAISAAYYRIAKSYAANNQPVKSSIFALVCLFIFQDKYSKSVLVFAVKTLKLSCLLPKNLRAHEDFAGNS